MSDTKKPEALPPDSPLAPRFELAVKNVSPESDKEWLRKHEEALHEEAYNQGYAACIADRDLALKERDEARKENWLAGMTMTDKEILIWYEGLEEATANTEQPEAAIIAYVREHDQQVRQAAALEEAKWGLQTVMVNGNTNKPFLARIAELEKALDHPGPEARLTPMEEGESYYIAPHGRLSLVNKPHPGLEEK